MKQRYMTININVCIIKYKLKDNVDTFRINDIMRGGGNMQQMMKQMQKCKRKWLKNKKN